MDKERMLSCALHRQMDAETHNIPPGKIKAKKLFKGDQVVGRQGLHTTRSSGRISKRVVFDVPPDLYTLSYKSDAIQGSDLANKKTNL